MAYADQNDYLQAIIYYQQAIEFDDVYPQTRYNLGRALEGLGKTDDAILSYQTAIKMAPTFVLPYSSLLNLYLKDGQTKDALDLVETAIKTFPQDQSFLAIRARLLSLN